MALRSSLPRARRGPERPLPKDDLEASQANVALAAGGNAEAFGALYDRYHPEVLRYFRARVPQPELAAELTQHLFLRAWRAVPRYRDRGLPFAAWLLRMAHDLAKHHARGHRMTGPIEGLEIPSEQSGAVHGSSARERSRVERAFDRLSEDHRQVLILRFVLEQSAREVGQVMGRSEVSVRSLQLRALESLRAELGATGDGR